MQHEQLVDLLSQRLSVDAGTAELILDATVQALDEVAPDEMADVHAQLPGKLQNINPAGVNTQRSLDEFVVHVGDLTGVEDAARAREYTQAAFETIADSISAGQLRQLVEALPDEYGELAPLTSGITGKDETLLAEVRNHAGLETLEQARELTHAVLGALAEHGSAGQAHNLAAMLPPDARSAASGAERAAHTDPDDFFAELSDQVSVTNPDLVRGHTQSVLQVLRQWAPTETDKTLDQLPAEIRQLSRSAEESHLG